MEEKIVLPIALARYVFEILKKEYKVERLKKIYYTDSFTLEELSKIESIELEKVIPPNFFEGIELLPNLKTLFIKSFKSPSFTHPMDISSIDDKDISNIQKCKRLEFLEIINQPNISEIDLSKMSHLWSVNISGNSNLKHIKGIDKLPELSSFTCFGNKSLCSIENLDKAIIQSEDLSDLNLDVLLFPDAIGYKPSGEYNKEALQRMSELTHLNWTESVPIFKYTKRTTQTLHIDINHVTCNLYQMIRMHNEANKILAENIPSTYGVRDTIIAIERYLAENVTYDDESIESPLRGITTGEDTKILFGLKNGISSVYNCLVEKKCVCAGFARGEQYLLKLRGIRSREVECVGRRDTLGIADANKDISYSNYLTPRGDFHAILRIDDYYSLYSDPCTNSACSEREGKVILPTSLLTKEEIKDYITLYFEEKEVSNNNAFIPRKDIKESMEENQLFINTSNRQINDVRGIISDKIKSPSMRYFKPLKCDLSR